MNDDWVAQASFEATIIDEIRKGRTPDEIVDAYGFDRTAVWVAISSLVREGKLRIVVAER